MPEGFHISAAQLVDDGFVKVTWSHKLTPSDTGQERYYSGWLYQTGPYGDADFESDLSPRLWTAETFKDIPRNNGNCVMDDEDEYYRFLKTFIRYGAVLVKGPSAVPQMIETLPEKIGVIRTPNFGRIFEMKIKADPHPIPIQVRNFGHIRVSTHVNICLAYSFYPVCRMIQMAVIQHSQLDLLWPTTTAL